MYYHYILAFLHRCLYFNPSRHHPLGLTYTKCVTLHPIEEVHAQPEEVHAQPQEHERVDHLRGLLTFVRFSVVEVMLLTLLGSSNKSSLGQCKMPSDESN